MSRACAEPRAETSKLETDSNERMTKDTPPGVIPIREDEEGPHNLRTITQINLCKIKASTARSFACAQDDNAASFTA